MRLTNLKAFLPTVLLSCSHSPSGFMLVRIDHMRQSNAMVTSRGSCSSKVWKSNFSPSLDNKSWPSSRSSGWEFRVMPKWPPKGSKMNVVVNPFVAACSARLSCFPKAAQVRSSCRLNGVCQFGSTAFTQTPNFIIFPDPLGPN